MCPTVAFRGSGPRSGANLYGSISSKNGTPWGRPLYHIKSHGDPGDCLRRTFKILEQGITSV
ncbi:hypothetical protein M408DRAFT_326838 [Serendipita vermifera MAFF 305830]|uniref:Uncharacterized protein n=1 Tax=Serendipita vermifera MAFF 305830 TaxID=933852 RepID=A0A0C3B5T3_SERVB|nr:hypothetical protein M408DRAFT_326838 [Serendipita vermifera MAFF 305830]